MLGIFLFVVACIFYINTLSNGYNLDDEYVTINHRHTQEGIKAIPEIFKSPYYEDAAGIKFGYRPIAVASFAIEHQFFGENPKVGHAINILLYGLTVVLIFYLLSLLTQSSNILLPFLVALLFAIHPIHTEVVNSLKNRDEILALLFALSACIAFWKATHEKINISLVVIGLLSFALAILSKISIMPFAYFIPAFLILFRGYSLKLVSLISLLLAGISLFGFSGAIPIKNWNIPQTILLASSMILFPSMLHLFINKKKYLEKYLRFLEKYLRFLNMIPSLFISLGVLYFTIIEPSILYTSIIWIIGVLLMIPLKNHFIPSVILAGLGGFIHYQFNLNQFSFISLLPLFILASQTELTKEKKIAIYLIGAATIVYFITDLMLGQFNNVVPLVVFLTIFFFNRLNKIIRITIALLFMISSFIIGEPNIALNFIFLSLIILKENFRPDLSRKYLVIALLILVSCMGGIEAITKWQNLQSSMVETIIINPPETTIVNPPISNATERTIDFAENPLANETDYTKKIVPSIYISGWYLKMLVIPYPLSYYYGYDTIPIIHPLNWKVFFAGIVLLILLATGLFYAPNKPLILQGSVLLLVGIAQFSNLLVIVPGIVGERFLYAASLGFCMILAYILYQLHNKLESKQVNKYAFWGLIVILSLTCLTYTWQRNKQWKDKLTLYKNDIVYVPQSTKAHQLLGKQYIEVAGQTTDISQKSALLMKAIDHLEKCHSIYPSFPYVNVDLGDAYLQLNQYDEALNAFENATKIDTLTGEAFFKAGATAELLGEIAKAEKYYLTAIEKGKNGKDAYLNLTALYFNQSRFEEGILISESALNIWQDDLDILNNLGNGLFNIQRYQDALYIFERMYQQDQNPDTASKINYLRTQLN